MKWPKVTDSHDRVMVSDPPRGIGISIEKKVVHHYTFQILMLRRIDKPELGEPYEFWHGAN